MKTSDFDYFLPPVFIAQTPIEPRDMSRLMVMNRDSGLIVNHTNFRNIDRYFSPGDLLVLNQTRVIPARLPARKIPTGGKVEVLLLRRIEPQKWECIVGGKGLVIGKWVQFEGGLRAEIVQNLGGARRIIKFSEPLHAVLDDIGQMPLPPYIHEKLTEPNRYQTIYASEPGSAAAPTAGLHFTQRLLDRLHDCGIQISIITLHVGLDTFAPVNENDPKEHEIHTEWCQLTAETAERINQTKINGGRVIAVGTTSVRTLETAANQSAVEDVWATEYLGPTNLFILPGYEFKVVDAMITNFHLPRSTLIMLVSAFVGRENLLAAYQIAMQEEYRFYSFGDAMLIV